MLQPAHCVATTVAVLASTRPGLETRLNCAPVRHVVHMVSTMCRCGASRHEPLTAYLHMGDVEERDW